MTWGIRVGWEVVPPAEGLVNAMGKLWADVGETIIGTMVDNLKNMGVYMYAAMTAAFCALLMMWAERTWVLGYLVSGCAEDLPEEEVWWW
jgi:hypothetical protein